MANEKKPITIEECLQYLFQCRDQVHLWHLQTTSFSEHKALGKLYEAILTSTDEIIEVWQGHDRRVAGIMPIKTAPYKDVDTMKKYLAQVMGWLSQLRAETPYEEMPNLIDNLTAKLARTIYLLTLE